MKKNTKKRQKEHHIKRPIMKLKNKTIIRTYEQFMIKGSYGCDNIYRRGDVVIHEHGTYILVIKRAIGIPPTDEHARDKLLQF